MIYWRLFAAFLKIGLFSFGGAYGAIPLIRDVVMEEQWADEAMFANLVALSESTPGPIMVNTATYVGFLGVILPAFVILLAVTIVFQQLLKRRLVQAVLKGVKPCLMGVILSTGVWMALSLCLGGGIDWTACGILLLLVLTALVYKRLKKADFPPIALILLAALLGGVLY